MQHTTKNIGVKIEARSLQFENFCLMTVELIYYYYFFFSPPLESVFKQHQALADNSTCCKCSELRCWSAVNNVRADACCGELFALCVCATAL